MWIFMIKIDAESLFQNGNYLVWSPNYFVSPGSHGNIGGSILRGTRRIPSAVGRWTTSMKGIALGLSAMTG